MLHLVVGHIDLHAAKGFTVGFRYMSPILVNPFFAILVLIDNDILSRIFARNVLRCCKRRGRKQQASQRRVSRVSLFSFFLILISLLFLFRVLLWLWLRSEAHGIVTIAPNRGFEQFTKRQTDFHLVALTHTEVWGDNG